MIGITCQKNKIRINEKKSIGEFVNVKEKSN